MATRRYIFLAILIIELTFSTDNKGVVVAAEETLCKGKPCLLAGECTMLRSGRCACKQGYKFEDETNTKCVDIDECGSHFYDPCGHRGICQNFIGSYNCSCLQGWSGENSHCSSNVSSDTRCVPGYGGPRCHDSMCGQNGYSETVGVDDYRCICSDGWTHTFEKGLCDIDVDECEQPDVCSNKGLCHNTQGSYACVCLSGWEGLNCSSYNYTVRPCENGGSCVDSRCLCTKEWTGNDCSSYVPIDIDSLNQGSYGCVCLSGWEGANCSSYNCTVRPCENGGTCVDGRCLCTKEWTGNDCSSYVPIDIDSLTQDSVDRFLLYGGCGILMFLIITLLVSVWCAYKNKKQRTTSPDRTMVKEIDSNDQLPNV